MAEQEFAGMVSMFQMGFDAMYSPYPEKYERLGKVISQIPHYLAHMSAAEWGSLTVDLLPAIIKVGSVIIRTAIRIWSKLSTSAIAQILRNALPKLVATGAKQKWIWEFGKISEADAGLAYRAIQESSTDVHAISTYTGYKESRISRIKEYVFNNPEWTGPDPDIAETWHRLRTGRGTPNDRLLLKHETAEMWYRQNVNPDYSTAHRAANSKWNWQQTLEW